MGKSENYCSLVKSSSMVGADMPCTVAWGEGENVVVRKNHFGGIKKP
jgi:hypothetical protein